MKLRLIFSLALNVLLLGLVLWLARVESSAEPRPPISRLLTNRVLRLKPRPAPLPDPAPSPEVVEVAEPFHWAQLESADYRAYIANLRGIGCPESTVRAILVADVNDLFSVRVKALVDGVTGKFWDFMMRQKDFENLVDVKGKELRALDEERDELFTALFGQSNPHAEEEERASAYARREQREQFTDFLPVEKREQIILAWEELESARAELFGTLGLTGPQQQARRQELETAHDRLLREWLTPDEYAELRLRQSPAADLRQQLVGMDLSEEQIRAAARMQLAATDAQAALSQKDADFKARTAQLEQEADAQTLEALGAETYAAFQRATDQRYAAIYRVAQRLELSDDAAAQAYEIRRQAEEAASRLRNDMSLSIEERQENFKPSARRRSKALPRRLGTEASPPTKKLTTAGCNN